MTDLFRIVTLYSYLLECNRLVFTTASQSVPSERVSRVQSIGHGTREPNLISVKDRDRTCQFRNTGDQIEGIEILIVGDQVVLLDSSWYITEGRPYCTVENELEQSWGQEIDAYIAISQERGELNFDTGSIMKFQAR